MRRDWRLLWPDVGELRVHVDSISRGKGASGRDPGRSADVNDDPWASEVFVDMDPARESMIERRLIETYELLRDW